MKKLIRLKKAAHRRFFILTIASKLLPKALYYFPALIAAWAAAKRAMGTRNGEQLT